MKTIHLYSALNFDKTPRWWVDIVETFSGSEVDALLSEYKMAFKIDDKENRYLKFQTEEDMLMFTLKYVK